MIRMEFLNELANVVEQKIAKVVLNASVEITEFEVKQVDSQVVTLNYLVPASAVSVINLIELRAVDDSVISTNTVEVPITADTIMVQTLEVREVS